MDSSHDKVIDCYRFHFGLAEGDPSLEPLERTLATKPKINVPAVTLDGLDDPLKPGGTAQQGGMFIDRHEHRAIKAGHNVPQEAPMAFAEFSSRLEPEKVLRAGPWLSLRRFSMLVLAELETVLRASSLRRFSGLQA